MRGHDAPTDRGEAHAGAAWGGWSLDGKRTCAACGDGPCVVIARRRRAAVAGLCLGCAGYPALLRHFAALVAAAGGATALQLAPDVLLGALPPPGQRPGPPPPPLPFERRQRPR